VAEARLTPAAQRALLSHAWPGNVRELRNAVERALVLGDGAVRPADLFGEEAAELPGPLAPLRFPATMEEVERAAARATLEQCGGNKTRAAEVLQISRKRLYALLNRGESDHPTRRAT
jgi:DNA-binding NtrC family response regulator